MFIYIFIYVHLFMFFFLYVILLFSHILTDCVDPSLTVDLKVAIFHVYVIIYIIKYWKTFHVGLLISSAC